jgi:hypothetical protein
MDAIPFDSYIECWVSHELTTTHDCLLENISVFQDYSADPMKLFPSYLIIRTAIVAGYPRFEPIEF